MATNTFERKIELRDVKSVKKLYDVINSNTSTINLIERPFSEADRKRSEMLLNQSLLRSRH